VRIPAASSCNTDIARERDAKSASDHRQCCKTEEADRKVVNRMAVVAKARGISRAQVALAWLLAKPVITAPIVGATKLHHLDDALAAVNVKLAADEISALEDPYVPHAVVGFV
jgi:aryl-alcohol dehydrogenase-like predicted oxidoreductase